MTEDEARDAYSNAAAYEGQLRTELAFANATLKAANAYCDAVAEPGWPEAATYVEFTVFSLGLISLVTPVGWMGVTVSYLGFATAGWGLAGATAYTTQALSRTFPGLPGAAANSNKGESFDRLFFGLAYKKNAIAARISDSIRDNGIKKFLSEAGAAITTSGLPNLPDKNLCDDYREFITKELDKIQKEIDRFINDKNEKNPSRKELKNPSQQKRQNNQSLPKQNPVKLNLKSGNDGKNPKESYDHSHPYAGSDHPGPKATTTA